MNSQRGDFPAARLMAKCWLALTALAAAATALFYAAAGMPGLRAAVQEGPLSIGAQTFAAVGTAWCAFGAASFAAASPKLAPRRKLEAALAAALVALAANFLRERIHYIDVVDYVAGARALAAGEPFPARYLYPPMLATLLQPLLPLGDRAAEGALWLANLGAFGLFFILLARLLERCGFGRSGAALAFAFLLVNVPAMRTLAYVQVNFHMMNLVLLALLLRGRSRALSALALAAAVNLKGTPVVFALLFLAERDWKWLAWFAAWGLAIAGATFALYGALPFASFLANARGAYAANGICYRECSLDALARSSAAVFGAEGARWVWAVKGPALAALAAGAVYCARKGAARGGSPDAAAEAALPMLFGLMTFVSPLVWVHHFVFMAPAFLFALRKISGAGEWTTWAFAWIFVYALPAFDFWPWSFCRTAGAFAALALWARACGRGAAPRHSEFERRLAGFAAWGIEGK